MNSVERAMSGISCLYCQSNDMPFPKDVLSRFSSSMRAASCTARNETAAPKNRSREAASLQKAGFTPPQGLVMRFQYPRALESKTSLSVMALLSLRCRWRHMGA